MTPANSDVLVMPDPDSFTQLPWKPEVAWLACNPTMDGQEIAQVGTHDTGVSGGGLAG